MSSCCLRRMVYSDRIVNARYQRRPAVTIDCIKHVARNCNEKKNWIIIAGGQGDWKTGLKKTRQVPSRSLLWHYSRAFLPTHRDRYKFKLCFTKPPFRPFSFLCNDRRYRIKRERENCCANNRIYIKSATWSALCLPLDLSIDFLPLVTLAPFIDSLQCYPSP